MPGGTGLFLASAEERVGNALAWDRVKGLSGLIGHRWAYFYLRQYSARLDTVILPEISAKSSILRSGYLGSSNIKTHTARNLAPKVEGGYHPLNRSARIGSQPLSKSSSTG